MESTGLKIEKLRDKDNWLQWRFVMRTLLEEDDDVIGVCNGTLVHPEAGSATHDADRKRFLKADKIARKLIVTAVEKKPLDLLLSCTTAHEMWRKLNAVYDMKSDENLSMVQKQFFNFKWEESESIAHNLSKLEQLAAKMKALGSDVGEKMLITRILTMLPKKFSHFHSAWDSVDESKKTIENLTARLITEESRWKEDNEDQEASVALITKGNHYRRDQQKSTSKFENEKQSPSCFNCGKIGHLKKDCFRCFTCKRKGHTSKNCFRNNRKDSDKGNWKPRSQNQGGSYEKITNKLGLLGRSPITPAESNDIWIIDSGASEHMTGRREWFSVFEEYDEKVKIEIGNGQFMYACGKGNIEIETFVNGKWLPATMHDVLYVPEMKRNLFSVKFVAKKGIDFSISKQGKECMFLQNQKIIAKGSDIGNLYKLDMRVVVSLACNLGKKIESKSDTLQIWHERLCHQNVRHVKDFLKNLDLKVINNDFFCEGCAYGKQHRSSFHDKIERATKPREIIYADVCGPMEVESLGKKLYFLIFKDDFSKFTKIYFLRHKSEVIDKLKAFCLEIENQFEYNIKEIHSDGGREFKNKEVEKFLSSKGIKHTINVPYTPEQNGVAERENRTIVEAGRSMLYSKTDLPLFLWAEAMNTAVYVINKTGPTKQSRKTPYELWYGKPPGIENFKIFGTECFVHIPAEKRRKLDAKSKKGYLVGYLDEGKGYRVYVPSVRDIVLSRDVKFKPEQVTAEIANVPTSCIEKEVDENIQSDDDTFMSAESEDEAVNNENVRQLRNRQAIRQTEFYGCPITYLAEKVPRDFSEAMNSEKKELWKEAMLDEINSLHENKTWVLVEKPEKQKVINSKWVYTKKTNSDNSERYKARLVVKGYSQKEGIDYTETFSPVARFDTVRLMLSIAARNNMCLGQFDIKTAFLYGSLKENIYMKQPEGFHDGTNRVCKLIKSLYGLKQSPRCWTEHFTKFIASLKFNQSKADPCFYTYIENNKIMVLSIYVDDGLVAASEESLIDNLFRELHKEFKITCTKEVKYFLGVEICKLDSGEIFIHQSKYIENILEKFNMNNANSVSTPIETNWSKVVNNNSCKTPYREAVGNLIFLQTRSRPDISFAINVAARNLENPSEKHWQLVKRILRYLRGTAEMGLLYTKEGSLEAFSDADYASDTETRKSTSGVVCKYADAAITWQTKQQQCVAQSTTEAEYISAALGAKELIWLKKLLSDYKITDVNYTLNVDNTSALKLIKNPEFHQRSKHIDVKYHFIRDLYNKSEIDLMYVRSEEQLADVFTKALPKPRFEYLRHKLGLRNKYDIEKN